MGTVLKESLLTVKGKSLPRGGKKGGRSVSSLAAHLRENAFDGRERPEPAR